jgi:sugar O-acyltransferase (sialic acid O-acetyltransferase NeuD family)
VCTDLVIVGTGGQGREMLDIARAEVADGAKLNLLGFIDDAPSAQSAALVEAQGLPVLGDVQWLCTSGIKAMVLIGIGSGPVRRAVDRRLQAAGFNSPVIRHPSATIGSATTLSPGSCLWAGARLTTNVRVGRHVHVNQNATVGHDTVLADYVTLNPSAAVSGSVSAAEGALVGAGAVVLQGRALGRDTIVGAAACVTRNVRDRETVVGVPARTLMVSTQGGVAEI